MTNLLRLVFALVFFVTACAACSADADAPVERVDSPACDGRSLRHICGSAPFTATMQYGFDPACTTAPWLPGPGLQPAFRENGQEGCEELTLTVTGTKAARCCP
jgi:hypothetical protein